MLSEKYTPFTLNGIIGNGSSVEKLQQFGISVQSGKASKPIMICGPSGTGKTCAARALAYSNGFEILELSSSDYRDVETLTKKVLPVSATRGLFNRKVLILFDEIDELSSKFDAGAERVITELAKKSRQPIVFTANDFWDRKISFLRNYVERIEFKKVGTDDMSKYLREILNKEGRTLDEAVLAEIARRSDGDVRGALNDLDLMIDAMPELLESLGIRDRKMQVFAILDKIFLSSSFESARAATANSDIDMGMLINWVDENIPNRYKSKADINDSYRYLSRASAFFERASRINYYGYLRYAQVLLSSGVSVSNRGSISMLNPYLFPARIQHLSRAKKEKNEINAIASKMAPYLHSSIREIVRNSLPLINAMIERSKDEEGKEAIEAYMMKNYSIEPDEIETISKYYRFRSQVS